MSARSSQHYYYIGNMVPRMALVYSCCFASTLLVLVTGAAVTDPDFQSINAARGSALILSCNAEGCHLTQPRWHNISNGIREEIKSGIHPTTGELQVTRSATSVVGGQKYQCVCGENLASYEIHIPPKVSIKVEPQAVEVGGDCRVTCYTSEPGFPQPSTITLQYNGSHMGLDDGSPYVLHNLQLDDAGVLMCVVNDVNTQPFESSTLDVYEKVHIVKTINATVSDDHRMAIIGCLINGSEGRTLVNFSKDGVPIPVVDSHKFTELRHNQKDDTDFGRYLMVRDVTDSDEGVYTCRVYVNSTQWVLVDTAQLLISSQALITTGDTPKSKYKVELLASVGTTAAILFAVVVTVAVTGWALAVHWRRKYKTLTAKQKAGGGV